jgi:hypothetical protein
MPLLFNSSPDVNKHVKPKNFQNKFMSKTRMINLLIIITAKSFYCTIVSTHLAWLSLQSFACFYTSCVTLLPVVCLFLHILHDSPSSRLLVSTHLAWLSVQSFVCFYTSCMTLLPVIGCQLRHWTYILQVNNFCPQHAVCSSLGIIANRNHSRMKILKRCIRRVLRFAAFLDLTYHSELEALGNTHNVPQTGSVSALRCREGRHILYWVL